MPNDEPILPPMTVAGQTAVVTGAGKGIGRGSALALAEAGAHVVVMARTEADLRDVVETIEGKGGSAQAIAVDVTDTAAMRMAFGELERIDILVNNAGAAVGGALLDYDDADVRSMIELNCTATVFVAQAAAETMVRDGSGVIINLSSTFGLTGRPNHSVYAATKHFVEGFTKSIAIELAPKGIRVCAVGPTAIDTPLTHDRLHDPAIGGDLLARIPLGRFGEVTDVVGAVVFLASPAASLITGTTLMVDGGWTAQ